MAELKPQYQGLVNPGGRVFERPPVFGYDLNVESIGIETTGGVMNTPFPTAKLLVSYSVQTDIGLSGLILVTSILQPVAAKLAGIFVIIGEKPDTLAMFKAARMPMGHVTYQNSPGTGTPNPLNKTSSLSFGENSAMRINSGQFISLYGSGDNIAQTFAALLTILTVSLDKR